MTQISDPSPKKLCYSRGGRHPPHVSLEASTTLSASAGAERTALVQNFAKMNPNARPGESEAARFDRWQETFREVVYGRPAHVILEMKGGPRSAIGLNRYACMTRKQALWRALADQEGEGLGNETTKALLELPAVQDRLHDYYYWSDHPWLTPEETAARLADFWHTRGNEELRKCRMEQELLKWKQGYLHGDRLISKYVKGIVDHDPDYVAAILHLEGRTSYISQEGVAEGLHEVSMLEGLDWRAAAEQAEKLNDEYEEYVDAEEGNNAYNRDTLDY